MSNDEKKLKVHLKIFRIMKPKHKIEQKVLHIVKIDKLKMTHLLCLLDSEL